MKQDPSEKGDRSLFSNICRRKTDQVWLDGKNLTKVLGKMACVTGFGNGVVNPSEVYKKIWKTLRHFANIIRLLLGTWLDAYMI